MRVDLCACFVVVELLSSSVLFVIDCGLRRHATITNLDLVTVRSFTCTYHSFSHSHYYMHTHHAYCTHTNLFQLSFQLPAFHFHECIKSIINKAMHTHSSCTPVPVPAFHFSFFLQYLIKVQITVESVQRFRDSVSERSPLFLFLNFYRAGSVHVFTR